MILSPYYTEYCRYNMSSTLFLIPTKISKQVDNISKSISNNYHIDHKYHFDKRNSNNCNNYLFLYISPVLNPVNTPIIPHSKALFSLEMYKFFLSHLHIKPNVPSAHFPKMSHNVDFQNYVSNIHMRIAIYRANYLMLLLPSYTLYFSIFKYNVCF